MSESATERARRRFRAVVHDKALTRAKRADLWRRILDEEKERESERWTPGEDGAFVTEEEYRATTGKTRRLVRDPARPTAPDEEGDA